MIEYDFICPKCKKHIFGNVKLQYCPDCGSELQLQFSKNLTPKTKPKTEQAEEEPKLEQLEQLEEEQEDIIEEDSDMPDNAIILTKPTAKSESTIIFEGKQEVESAKTFHVDLEETAQLGEPFVCIINHDGKKLYLKKGEKVKEGTILVPLSKEELKSLSIEETVNDNLQNYFNVKIEEVW